MRGLVTSRPLFVAGLAFWSRADLTFTETGLPIDPTRVPVDGGRGGLLIARSAPAAARRLGYLVTGLVQRGGLPAERSELARDRDRDRPRRLAALCGEVHPAPVQALLTAPGDLYDTRILS